MGDWSNLPNDLLMEISKRLTTNTDYVRLQAVCIPWRSCLPKKSPHRLPCQLPWLILPGKDNHTTHRGFFNLSNNKVYHLELPEACGKHCWGSSEGWLAFVEDSPAITLLNPLTRTQIQLPPVTTFPDILDFRISEVGEEYLFTWSLGDPGPLSLEDLKIFYMEKIVLSKNPTVDNFIAMAICREVSKLAFCRSGDDKWTVIEDGRSHRAYSDIIYFKGQFYAVNCGGRVVVCDIDGPSPKTRNIKPPVNLCCETDKQYLVDLSGELLLVYKHTRESVVKDENGVEADFYQTLFFKVFKLNRDGRKWVKVKSLGDSMLFLGHNSSLSLSAKDFTGCKANCIYFTDDFFVGECFTKTCRGGHDIGVFNLEDASVEPFPCYMEESMLKHQPPVWVTPSLC